MEHWYLPIKTINDLPKEIVYDMNKIGIDGKLTIPLEIRFDERVGKWVVSYCDDKAQIGLVCEVDADKELAINKAYYRLVMEGLVKEKNYNPYFKVKCIGDDFWSKSIKKGKTYKTKWILDRGELRMMVNFTDKRFSTPCYVSVSANDKNFELVEKQ